jgi:dihydrofolate reductase
VGDSPKQTGKVVVNRSISIDGFIAGTGGNMRWGERRRRPGDFIPWEDTVEAASRTGAMLVGRNTAEVGNKMEAEKAGSDDYPFNGPIFLLTHRPLDPPDPDVTILSGDIGEAIATALAAANGKDLELLGASVASQAFKAGLVDEVLIYVLPVVLGEGVPFSPAGSATVDLEPISSRQSGEATILRFRVRK